MKKIWRSSLCYSLLLIGSNTYSQTSDNWSSKPELSITGFMDVFYCYDFNQPTGNARQNFFFNHNRHNEFSVNLALVQFEIEHSRYRSKLVVQAGTYPNDNYAAEDTTFKNIGEASIGLALSKNKKFWIDAGIFASHMGFESAMSSENWTLTRSLVAENSPYFLAGSKISYSPNKKWMFTGIVCNGWQRIRRVAGNSMLSFGSQVNYKPKDKVEFNWSTFIGTDDPDSTRRMRYFSDLYSKFNLSKNVNLLLGLDAGIQQRSKESNIYDTWVGPVLIAQYSFSEKFKIAGRAEYYQDQTGIIIQTQSGTPFRTNGYSINLDFLPKEAIYCRLEGRYLTNPTPIFETNLGFTSSNFFITGSIAIHITYSRQAAPSTQ